MPHLSVACAHQNGISTDSAQVASHMIHSLELQKDSLEVVKSDLPGNIRLASNILKQGNICFVAGIKCSLICCHWWSKLLAKRPASCPASV